MDRVQEIFLLVHHLRHAEQQRRLPELCGDDAQLLEEVESLLASLQDAPPLLDRLVNSSTRARLDPEAAALESIGPYRVQRFLGRGSSGIVYQALQVTTGRVVAVKLMLPGSIGGDRLARFNREIQVLARLEHPGVAQIYDADLLPGDGEGQPYFAMEYVPGSPLDQYVADEALGTWEVCSLVAEICDAAHYAHEEGVVHRDLKPANILVSGNGSDRRMKILDFGIASCADEGFEATLLTQTGQLVGTLPYASPEQISRDSKSIDRRADVYAIGAMLYELLAKRPAVQLAGLSLRDVIQAICDKVPERLGRALPEARGDLEAIVAKALSKDRNDRYETAAGLGDDLRRLLHGMPVLARVPSGPERALKWASRNRLPVLVAAAFAFLLLAGITGTTVLAARADRNATRADKEARASSQVAYAASVRAAAAMLRVDPLAAEEHLLRAPVVHRGWEWNYLMQQVETPKAMGAFGELVEDTSAIGFTAEGLPICVVAGDKFIRATDVASGRTLSRMATDRTTHRLSISGDGSRVAVLGSDATGESPVTLLAVYDTMSGEMVSEVELPQPVLPYLAMDARGRTVALSSVGGRGGIVDVELSELRTHAYAVVGTPSFDSDGTSACFGRNLIDVSSCRRIKEFAVKDAAWHRMSPQGTYVVGMKSRRRPVIVDSTDRMGEAKRLLGLRDYAGLVAFSSDESLLAAVGKGGQTLVWDLETERLLRWIPTRAWDVIFAPNGPQVLTVGAAGPELWDVEHSGSQVLRGHGSFVYSVAWNGDGTRIVSGDFTGEVRVWDGVSGEDLGRLERGDGLDVAAWKLWFSASGEFIVIPGSPLCVWSLKAWQQLDGAGIALGWNRLRSREGMSPDGLWDVMAGNVRAAVRDGIQVESNGQAFRLPFEPQVEPLQMESARAAQKRANLALIHNEGDPSLAIDPLGMWLAVGCADGRLEIWDLETRSRRATLLGHFGPIYDLDVSPDGRRIVSGGSDATVRIWDSGSFQELAVLDGHDDYVHAVAFSPDGSKIVSGSGDKTLRIWSSRSATVRK